MTTLETIRRLAAARAVKECGVCAFDVEKRPLLSCRAMSRLPQEARSVVVVLFPYAFEENGERNISRYACVPDYHEAAGAVLAALCDDCRAMFPEEKFEAFMDNSPLPEVACAVAAGLGVRGDHGLLINETYGSYVFIGCIVTTAQLPCEEMSGECLHCGACARACGGGCLSVGGRESCLSAITQKKGELTTEECAAIRRNGLLWGCDTCQEVCPMNRGKRIDPHPCFTWYDPLLTTASLSDLTGKAYSWRGKAVLMRNLSIFEDEGMNEDGDTAL
ncbi:MAG: epoxyqueuosine reductase [Clostridia bacterium]|nr:epoxyqueuosine reductase [Clostridia bacterium]